MGASPRSPPTRDSGSPPERATEVLLCETCPGRSVLVETGNAHGWIATDLTVDLDR